MVSPDPGVARWVLPGPSAKKARIADFEFGFSCGQRIDSRPIQRPDDREPFPVFRHNIVASTPDAVCVLRQR
jgi:hypothetical protein